MGEGSVTKQLFNTGPTTEERSGGLLPQGPILWQRTRNV